LLPAYGHRLHAAQNSKCASADAGQMISVNMMVNYNTSQQCQ